MITEAEPVVEMRGITVEFPSVTALDGVDFTLRPGEVHALLGENGAGKSTLIKALTGIHRPTTGTIVVDGRERSFSGPGHAQEAGISTVYQEVNLCRNLSIAENIMLGHEVRRGPIIDWRTTRRRSEEHLARLNLDVDPKALLSSQSIAIQQLVAICRAMVIDARVLILDEPTSSLDTDEVHQLFTVLDSLREDGVAILFVSHFLDQVYAISDRMTILRNGRLVGEHRTDALPRLQLISAMVGTALDELEEVEERQRKPRAVDADEADPQAFLVAEGIGRRGAIQPFDLTVRPGEVVGLAGLLGSGRTELARLLCGADTADEGTLRVNGKPVRLRSPRAALGRGIAYSSEDRKGDGIVGELTISENIVLGLQAERGWTRPLPSRQVEEVVGHYIAALDIRPADPEARMSTLSGGNQQKVLLARWLATEPQLLILDEPTRGIDVGAKAEIQRLVADLAADGMAVVFISAELDEVVRLSHRIAVLRDRRKVAEVDKDDTLEVDDIVELIAGTEG